MQRLARLIAPRFHYSWLALAVVFLILLCAAGTRATPSVMMLPLEHEFGWSRSTISLAISIGIALYGLTGPFAAASMQYFGIRPTVLGALAVLVAGTALSAMMHAPWQMVLLWSKRMQECLRLNCVLTGGCHDAVKWTSSPTTCMAHACFRIQ